MGLNPSPPPASPVTLEFELSWEEWIDAAKAAHVRSKENRASLNFWSFCLPPFYVISVFLAFKAGAGASEGEESASLLALLCILTAVVAYWMAWVRKSWGPVAVEQEILLNEEAYRLFTGHRKVEIDPEGLVYETEHLSFRLPWSAISQIEEGEDWVILYFFDSPLVIPTTAFYDEAARRSFLHTVQESQGDGA